MTPRRPAWTGFHVLYSMPAARLRLLTDDLVGEVFGDGRAFFANVPVETRAGLRSALEVALPRGAPEESMRRWLEAGGAAGLVDAALRIDAPLVLEPSRFPTGRVPPIRARAGDRQRAGCGAAAGAVRKEVELAKEEVRIEAAKATNMAKLFGGAGGAAYFAVLMLLFAAAWGLSEIVPEGVAFLIVGVVLAIIAAVLAMRGRKQAQSFNPKPEQTIETLQETRSG